MFGGRGVRLFLTSLGWGTAPWPPLLYTQLSVLYLVCNLLLLEVWDSLLDRSSEFVQQLRVHLLGGVLEDRRSFFFEDFQGYNF